MGLKLAIIATGLSVVVSAQQPDNRFVSADTARNLINQLTQGPLSSQIRLNVPAESRLDFSKAVGWLGQARIPDQVPASLVRSLRVDVALLSSERNSATSRKAAADDVIWKGELCRISPAGLGATIPVSVRTLAANAESKGWEVVYKTAPEMEDPKIPPTPFPAFSSPTNDALPAALYHFWARDPKQPTRVGQSRQVPINSRTPTVTVDLVAPQ